MRNKLNFGINKSIVLLFPELIETLAGIDLQHQCQTIRDSHPSKKRNWKDRSSLYKARTFNPAILLLVNCENQERGKWLWNKFLEGRGKEDQSG
jgi:hypothetical protein